MEILWFWVVAVMIAVYVVLDGFDLGAGAIHLLVARSDEERRTVFRSIGPVWDGNEVWLLAGGGTLFCAFPALYASSFSGFYLPLMIVLWLLILRGASIEFRSHVDSHLWASFWDVVFMGASGLLAVFYGAALGNVVRGVPLDKEGYFFLPLWTNFHVGAEPGILDWYTVIAGVTALATLVIHGALWVSLKTEGDIRVRSQAVIRHLWWVLGTLTAVLTLASFSIQPQLSVSFTDHPAGFVFPLLAVAGWIGMRFLKDELHAFLGSCVYIVGMLTSAAFGVFPYVLPSVSEVPGLTVYNAAASQYGLNVALLWFIPGALLAIGYFVFTYRHFAGKVKLEEGGSHY